MFQAARNASAGGSDAHIYRQHIIAQGFSPFQQNLLRLKASTFLSSYPGNILRCAGRLNGEGGKIMICNLYCIRNNGEWGGGGGGSKTLLGQMPVKTYTFLVTSSTNDATMPVPQGNQSMPTTQERCPPPLPPKQIPPPRYTHTQQNHLASILFNHVFKRLPATSR